MFSLFKLKTVYIMKNRYKRDCEATRYEPKNHCPPQWHYVIKSFTSDYTAQRLLTLSVPYEKAYHIRSYEVAPSGQAAIFTLLNYLQDAASEHAEKLGFSVSALQEKGVTWVLSRYRVRILHYPRLNDRVRLCTWLSGRGKWTTTRDLELFDQSGRKLLEATTTWALLDLERGRPAKVEEFTSELPILPHKVFDRDPVLPGKIESTDQEESFLVRYGDLDLNRHVNNAIYIAWALETVPGEQLQFMLPVELEIAYRAPANYGDRIESRMQFLPNSSQTECLHALRRTQDDKELVRMRSRWLPVDDFA